jgi:hypothetical protein
VIDDQERPRQGLGPGSLVYVFDLNPQGQVTHLRAAEFPWLMGCDLAGTDPTRPCPTRRRTRTST